MKLGLSSLLSPRVAVDDVIELSAKLGTECVEVIFDVPHFMPEFDLRALNDLRELIDSYELEVSVHASLWDLNPASHHREVRELTVGQVKRSIDACHLLGGRMVVAHPGHCPAREVEAILEGNRRRFREFAEKCLRYAKELGITFTIENIDRADFPYSTVEELKSLAEDLEGLRMTYDVGHAYLARRGDGSKSPEAEIAEEIERVGDLLAHVHLHDNRGFKDEHLPPGEGEINFEPIVEALKAMGYDEQVIVEIWNPKSPMEAAREGLRRIRDLFK